MESQALERSALESKDREELQTIIVALGGKAPSRARKATLVDLVLELAGVVESTDDGDDDEATPETSDQSSDETSGETSGQTSDDDAPAGADEAATPSDDAGGDGAASAADDGSDEPAGRAAPGSSTGGRRTRGGGRGRSADAEASPDAGDDGRPAPKGRGDQRGQRQGKGEQGQDGRKGRGEQADRDAGGQDRGNGQGDDGESGNRRRRRRGRDRDRERGDDGWQGDPVEVAGLLDLRDDGYGFLRLNGYLPSRDDVYVSVKQVRQFGLRKGDHVAGASRPASRSEKNPALLRIDAINGEAPEKNLERATFDELTPLFPDERLRLEVEGEPQNATARIIDLVAPIGKGQRGLIVAPPKAGKTMVMKQIARSVEANHPDVTLLVLLLDERPEEVTDFRRSLDRGEVIASTFDRPADEHAQVAELAIERAKRLVERGEDVVVILDGITRLARAYNLSAPPSGRIMSGGIDASALYPPKRIFGAARNLEEGGSLTIMATALVETNSKMDEHIFEEFKGTGNMELKLDRGLAERRVFPAIDVDASSTRHEELLYSRAEKTQVLKLRRVLSGLADSGKAGTGLEMLVERLGDFETNAAFLKEMAKAPT